MDIGPDVETHHHHHTGRQWIDVILGVSVVAISIVSLLLAMENGRAMKQLVAANSWPFVFIGYSNGDEQGDKFLTFVIQNKGVGPAKIETMEVFYKGRPMADLTTLIHAILGPQANGVHIPFISQTIVGDVLSSKENINFVEVKDKSIGRPYLERLSAEAGNIAFRTCYCSVFDECWLVDHTSGALAPKPVKVCPVPAHPFAQ